MNQRIKELRKILGLSQEEFAAQLGLTRGAITNIEHNKTEPKPLLVQLICKEFKVNEIWLRTGVGDPFQKKDRSQEMTELFADLMNDRPESFRTRLITALLRFSPDGPEWAALESIYNSIQAEAEKKTDP